MAEQMEYSVLMSVYGKEKPEYLRASMESMRHQTLPPADFVLVCDGPLNDGLEQVIAQAKEQWKERLQCIRLPKNRGLGRALREGILHCRCEIVARMDSDDISRPDRCRLQLEEMNRRGCDIISGGLQEFIQVPGDADICRMLPETSEQIRAFAGKRNPFNHPCVMYRKSAVLKAGNYQDFPGFEDYYLWLRMLAAGSRGWNLQQVILDMRTGNGMYARRGGLSYVKYAIRIQRFMYSRGMIGTAMFLKNCLVRTVVGVIPGGARTWFYRTFLRRKQA